MHHYVPQVYLRGFSKGAKPQEQIGVLSLLDGKRFTRNIRKTGAQTHFNTIDGDDPLAIESWLAKIEADAKGVIDAIALHKRSLNMDERHALSDFMSLQTFRGPDSRSILTSVVGDVFQKMNEYAKRTVVTRDALWALGFDPNKFDIDEINARGRAGEDYFTSPTDVPQDDQIDVMILAARSVLPYFINSPWRIIHFPDDTLITSDAPVTRVSSLYFHDRAANDPMHLQTTVFPLTRNCALTIPPSDALGREAHVQMRGTLARAGHLDSHVTGGKEEAHSVNRVTMGGAYEYVYFHPDDSSLVEQ